MPKFQNPASVLICTVGTSMLAGKTDVPGPDPTDQEVDAIFRKLTSLATDEHACGAEINSCHHILNGGYAREDCTIVLVHSATPGGRLVAKVLEKFFNARKHAVKTAEVPDLQDENPDRFRTHGLRNLANVICKELKSNGGPQCAINATGGYKAQIAIAVLIGQSLRVPVYYLHEKFKSIISLPPMPVAPDINLWLRHTHLFYKLAAAGSDPIPAESFNLEPSSGEPFPSELAGLLEIESIDRTDYLALTPTGIVFHEAIIDRLGPDGAPIPPPREAGDSEKKPPKFKQGEAHLEIHRPELERYLEALIREVPYVRQCIVNYFNRDLPKKNHFRIAGGEIEGIYSNGSFTAKFRVLTTAETEPQRLAVTAKLNEWAAAR